MPTSRVVTVPIRTFGPNTREMPRAKASRVKKEREQVTWNLLATGRPPPLPVVVTLTRLGPRTMDAHDNLRATGKPSVDAISAWLGCDDADGRVEWRYAQEKSKTYAVRIEITSRGAT